MKNVEKILSQNKIKYKTYPAAPMLDIDLENPEEIADALRNKSAGLLGDMLYKESIYYLKSICGINFQSQIFFFNDKCTNISLQWHIKSNPSLRNGYIASEKLRTYITQQYPEKKFEPAKVRSRQRVKPAAVQPVVMWTPALGRLFFSKNSTYILC